MSIMRIARTALVGAIPTVIVAVQAALALG